MFSHEFMRLAFLAGTFVALACGLVGYFVVLRAQVFAGDALSHVAFTGALAAAAAGVDLRLGLFGATVMVGLVIGGLGRRSVADDVTIGIGFSWVLGLGVLFLAVFAAGSGGGQGVLAARTLFGSVFGLSVSEAWIAAGVGVGVVLVLCVIARPLLFASVDAVVAAARGVPVRVLSLLLLGLLGVVAAEATQAVGAMLMLGLIAAPAGAALQLSAVPATALALSGGFAVLSMWAGLALAYAVPSLPPGSAVVMVACGVFALAAGYRQVSSLRRANG